MIPKSISASALQTAATCLARYHAENIQKTPDMDSTPAMVGTTVHAAIERFVQEYCIDKTLTEWNIEILKMYYLEAFVKTFNHANIESEEYLDGWELTQKWFIRTDVRDHEVISCEVKSTFDVRTSIGVIPFTYIWDRIDKIGPGEYRVVDYKTLRARIPPDELKKKIQPRAYSLAARIQFPDAERIWVELDMLRHESPISAVFTRDDDADSYRYIQREAERIIAQPDDDPENNPLPETLNADCAWCVRKSECETLLKHSTGGGILGKTPYELAEKMLEVAGAMKALKYLEEELNESLVAQAEHEDMFEWEEEDLEIKITARSSKKLTNTHAAAKVIGPELMDRYGNLTVTNVQKLLKSGELTPDQVTQLKSFIETSYGDPKAKVTRKTI